MVFWHSNKPLGKSSKLCYFGKSVGVHARIKEMLSSFMSCHSNGRPIYMKGPLAIR
ncbi:hypothetical protein LguiB_030936 [Lonicera macranthoides]